ncbi:MAG TPA: hypothetical protein PLB67_03265 [Candidatus Hydrogenedentes bacterium]|jgi:ATP phosphoribosyltransferase|nr:hypothetical protein [FCB group bacterium]NLT60685.1 hypothetical protein [Candidatus Hydrogenedentota bacterium]HNV20463.1 hypothetical protein [Candidatus Hydrogenedentota bacterium]HNZ18677.1 hypothetical protein [Candidatus Hydrogenedentota bacterium]HOH33982.1 hypothetical protein [Candidatus Hydrogenedentota bacterium]
MSNTQLIVGLPAGSLADPNRGGSLIELLKRAGFPARGYDKGGPSCFPLTAFLVGWDGRPQEFGSQLAVGEIDIAIGGDDWVRERTLEFKYEYEREITLKKVLSLDRGKVRIVIIGTRGTAAGGDAWLKTLLSAKPLVTMVSEMPYLALEWFRGRAEALGFGASHQQFSVQKFKTPPRIDRGIVIYETWGKTEAKVKNGSVDFGLEITQTGSAIENYGLCVLDEVMTSEAGIWACSSLRDQPEKYDIARMFLLNLYGSIYAEDKVLVTFNTRKEDSQTILDYLRDNRLFGEEPTINEGVNYTEYSIEMKADSVDLPLPRVRYELAKLGATSIETIPLDSSIPGLSVIDF